jgi:lipopolysaccharide export system permease protein
MRLPITLSRYIGKQLFLNCLMVLGVIMLVVGIGELVEMIRRSAGRDAMTLPIVLEMVLLKLPLTMERVLPFVMLIGGMLTYNKLSRSSELVVARAAGISAWQFLAPAVLVSAAIGVFFATVFNPLSAAMITRFERMEHKYISGSPSTLAISPSGLWLRHVEPIEQNIFEQPIEEYILHASRINHNDMRMMEVIIFLFGANDHFIGRIDAPQAMLKEGAWHIQDAIASRLGQMPRALPLIMLQTDLNIHQIKDNFASPKTMSFWQLPAFIDTLQKAGFPALRHQLYWLSLLALPLTLVAMLLIGSLFGRTHFRKGRQGLMLAGGVMAGFVLFFMSQLIHALGYAGNLPIALAAFLPPLIGTLIGLSAYLHVEDG